MSINFPKEQSITDFSRQNLEDFETALDKQSIQLESQNSLFRSFHTSRALSPEQSQQLQQDITTFRIEINDAIVNYNLTVPPARESFNQLPQNVKYDHFGLPYLKKDKVTGKKESYALPQKILVKAGSNPSRHRYVDLNAESGSPAAYAGALESVRRDLDTYASKETPRNSDRRGVASLQSDFRDTIKEVSNYKLLDNSNHQYVVDKDGYIVPNAETGPREGTENLYRVEINDSSERLL